MSWCGARGSGRSVKSERWLVARIFGGARLPNGELMFAELLVGGATSCARLMRSPSRTQGDESRETFASSDPKKMVHNTGPMARQFHRSNTISDIKPSLAPESMLDSSGASPH